MKVWELIAILSTCHAGSEVAVRRGEDTYAVGLKSVDTDSDQQVDGCVHLIGDGSESDDDDVQN